MTTEPAGARAETLEEFKNSFSYGSRSDLTFKFLKNLGAEEAATAIQRILTAVGTTFDTGSLEELHELIVELQIAAYRPAAGATRSYVYEDRPFTALTKPLAECRVGLLASSGHFAAGDDPMPLGIDGMTQPEAEARIGDFLREAPVLSTIPRELPKSELRVRHGGYDIRSSVQDFNVTLPRDALLAWQHQGRIRELADPIYSFPGAASQGRLCKHSLPGWLDTFLGHGIDVLLLVPV